MSGGGGHRLWFLGHYDPADQVSENSRAREDHHEQPDQADECHVQIQVFGDTCADASDFTILARAHKPLAGGYSAHPNSAIGADIGVVLNDLATVVAVHG